MFLSVKILITMNIYKLMFTWLAFRTVEDGGELPYIRYVGMCCCEG